MYSENISPKQYSNKLNSLNDGISPLLDDFKKLFILYKMNPQNQEYQQQFENITNHLNNIESKLFSISNEIQTNIENINKSLSTFNENIEKERKKNKEYKNILGIVENESKASLKLINDYKGIYDNNYLKNWGLVLSTLFCVYIISKTYKKSEVTQ
jgi:chromosome segregation ATPase